MTHYLPIRGRACVAARGVSWRRSAKRFQLAHMSAEFTQFMWRCKETSSSSSALPGASQNAVCTRLPAPPWSAAALLHHGTQEGRDAWRRESRQHALRGAGGAWVLRRVYTRAGTHSAHLSLQKLPLILTPLHTLCTHARPPVVTLATPSSDPNASSQKQNRKARHRRLMPNSRRRVPLPASLFESELKRRGWPT